MMKKRDQIHNLYNGVKTGQKKPVKRAYKQANQDFRQIYFGLAEKMNIFESAGQINYCVVAEVKNWGKQLFIDEK